MGNRISIFGSKYCRGDHMELVIDTESGLTRRIDGRLVFRLRKHENITLHKRRVLRDSSDNIVLTISKKVCSPWLVFKGDSEDPNNLAFSVKRSSSKCPGKDTINLDVFIHPKNTENNNWDCNVVAGGSGKGFYCNIFYRRSSTELAKMKVAENGDLKIKIKPNFDYAFIVALITIVAEKMSFERTESKTSKAGQHTQTAIGAVGTLASVGVFLANALIGTCCR